jgi:hypothetical protein
MFKLHNPSSSQALKIRKIGSSDWIYSLFFFCFWTDFIAEGTGIIMGDGIHRLLEKRSMLLVIYF